MKMNAAILLALCTTIRCLAASTNEVVYLDDDSTIVGRILTNGMVIGFEEYQGTNLCRQVIGTYAGEPFLEMSDGTAIRLHSRTVGQAVNQFNEWYVFMEQPWSARADTRIPIVATNSQGTPVITPAPEIEILHGRRFVQGTTPDMPRRKWYIGK